MAGTARWFGPNAKERLGITETLKELLGGAPKEVTGAYTPDAGDTKHVVEVNTAGPATVTINKDVFRAGDKLTLVQTGAGKMTVAAGAGFTLTPPESFTAQAAGRYATVVVTFRSPTAAILSGLLGGA